MNPVSAVVALPRENIDEHRTSNIEHPTLTGEAAVVEDDDDALPMPGRVWEGPRESLAAMMAKHVASIKPEPSPEPSNVSPVQAGDLSNKWGQLLTLLGPAMSGVLQHGELVGVEDGQAIIRFGPQHETFVKRLELNGKKELIRDSITKVMNQPLGVRFEISDTVPVTTAVAQMAAPIAAAKSEPTRRASPAAPPPLPENASSVRLTEEIRQNLYKTEPLIRAVVDQLGGSVIRLEE